MEERCERLGIRGKGEEGCQRTDEGGWIREEMRCGR